MSADIGYSQRSDILPVSLNLNYLEIAELSLLEPSGRVDVRLHSQDVSREEGSLASAPQSAFI